MTYLRAYIVSFSLLIGVLGLYTAFVLALKRPAEASIPATAWTEPMPHAPTATR